MKKPDTHISHFESANAKLQAGLARAMSKPREAYAKQRYNTPLFVAHEMLTAFTRHNILGMSASLSFYAMFALIPLVLLMFFLLSHLVLSSDYAVVKLAIITSNLVPKLSSTIMVEVYNASQQKAAWGVVGIFILLWAVTPLAGAMRSTFYSISAMIEAPSFIKRKMKDMIAVLGMLLLFFAFTFAGMMIEKVLAFLGAEAQFMHLDAFNMLTSLMLTSVMIGIIYYVFFPIKPALIHIAIGAVFTAVIWTLMRPAFSLFLSANENYGSVFGGMKNLFISITWLYFNFAVLLLGSELVAVLRKKDTLLIKNLFDSDQANAREASYLKTLMQRYGKTFLMDEKVFVEGDIARNFYFLLQGQVVLKRGETVIRTIEAGEYFGEMALFSNTPAVLSAHVVSETADIILIFPENIETLLLDEPRVAMQFLKQMATRLQQRTE